MGVVRGRTERYQDNEIVVAQPHLKYVATALHTLHVRYTPLDAIPELDLALIELDGVAAAVSKLRSERTEAARSRTPKRAATEVSDLDVLMFTLRKMLAKEHGGWTPAMGKNRRVDSVQGFPHISGGAAGEPRPVEEAFELRGDASRAGEGVRVGILDTRLVAHPALCGRYSFEPGSLLGPDDPTDELSGHATFVAGLILRRAPAAWLDVRHVLTDDRASSTSWQVARKMMEFADSGVHVLNLSFGCFTDDNMPPLVLARAVERLGHRFVLVAAAGNHGEEGEDGSDEGAEGPAWALDHPRPGPKTPMWPAALDSVVAVGAVGADHEPAPFSPRVPWVDLVAPGVEVDSAYLFGDVHIRRHEHVDGRIVVHERDVKFRYGHALWSGTSFAAANVTGQIAARVRPGRLSAAEVAEQLLRLPAGQGDDDVMVHRV